MYKEGLALNNQQWLTCHKTKLKENVKTIYIYKKYLALNNLKWLICHETQRNQILYI